MADEAPRSLFDRLGAALPIALTALSTVFAGLSNGELQRAMFWRSFAAQDQAKATNQWTFAGFKKDRSLICQAAAAQLRAQLKESVEGRPIEQDPKLPEIRDEKLLKLLAGIQARLPEGELIQMASAIPAATVTAAIDEAEKANERIGHELSANAPGQPDTAIRFEHERRRYQQEANLNQSIGYLYEARVKVSSATSEKHQRKSQNFFYAMLAAQIGAIVSSLALARKRRSALWAVAAVTGIIALIIGGSVYLAEV